MRIIFLSVVAWLTFCGPVFAETFETIYGYAVDGDDETAAILRKLDFKTGTVRLPGVPGEVTMPMGYALLTGEDAAEFNENVWGNPENSTMVGLLLKTDQDPRSARALGGPIYFSSGLFMTDATARRLNYDRMLARAQKSIADDNVWRDENGYDTVTLLGWTEPPSFNAGRHARYFSKTLVFGDPDENNPIINYHLVFSGRNMGIELEVIATPDEIAEARGIAGTFLNAFRFDPGSTYDDRTALESQNDLDNYLFLEDFAQWVAHSESIGAFVGFVRGTRDKIVEATAGHGTLAATSALGMIFAPIGMMMLYRRRKSGLNKSIARE